MPQYSASVLSVGIDTLTCSVPWEGGANSFIDLALYLQRDEATHGSKVTPFKRGAYRGENSKHVGLAFKPGRVLAELRGPLAHEFWPHFLDRAEKVSRIDLEVSVRQEPYDHQMAVRIWQAERDKSRPVGKPAKARLQAEDTGGSTLYLGTGASRYQARLYERFYKTHLEDDRDVWRYEVQARRERAQQAADLLRTAGDPLPLVQAAVHRHFLIRGVPPIFGSGADLELRPLPRPTTDEARSLNWLGTSVAPALRRHRAWGSYDRAKHALGIEDP